MRTQTLLAIAIMILLAVAAAGGATASPRQPAQPPTPPPHPPGPPPSTGDMTPPRVRALASSGRFGRQVRLHYTVSDASGETNEYFVVLRKGRVFARPRPTGFGKSDAGETYFQAWRAPKRQSGPWRFCVASVDRAGNGSTTSCARLTLS